MAAGAEEKLKDLEDRYVHSLDLPLSQRLLCVPKDSVRITEGGHQTPASHLDRIDRTNQPMSPTHDPQLCPSSQTRRRHTAVESFMKAKVRAVGAQSTRMGRRRA